MSPKYSLDKSRGTITEKFLNTMLFKKNINKNDQRPKFLFFLIRKTQDQTYKKIFRFKNTKHQTYEKFLKAKKDQKRGIVSGFFF